MRTLLSAFLAFILVGCESSRHSSNSRNDANLQNKIIGTWICYWGNGNVHSTTVVSAWGGYATQIEGFKYNRPPILIEGKFQVSNGDLVDTIIKYSQKSVTVPFVVHGHIKQLSDKLLIVRWDGREKDSEYQKAD